MSLLPHPSSGPVSSGAQPLKGENIAILVASGFDESVFLESLRALRGTGAKLTIVSSVPGLVQGWNGATFGHSHAVDVALSTALSADFSMLLVPPGARSMDKLKTNSHTVRFIKGCLSYGYPVAFLGDAVTLLAHVGGAAGVTVSGPAGAQAAMTSAGAVWSDTPTTLSNQILSAGVDDTAAIAVAVRAVVDHFVNIPDDMRLAA